MPQITCPRCSGTIPVGDDMAGMKIRCPQCTQKLQVPGNAPAALRSPAPMAPPPSGEKQWFYRRGGESFGPVAVADLKRLAREDELSRKDMLWSEGMENWQPAGKIHPRLFADGGREDSSGRMWEGAGVAIYSTIVGIVLLVMAGGMYLLIKSRTAAKDRELAAAAKEKDKEEPKAPAKPAALRPEEIATKCKPGVVRIMGKSGSGSGFLIEPGIVVTNFHVIDGQLVGTLEVSFPDGDPRKYRPKLLHEDRKNDLAVLRIDSTTQPLTLADAPPLGGSQVVVIGSPGSITSGGAMKNTVTVGNFGTTDTVDDVEVYHITAAINPGNSGGPAFDDRGRVFGVVTFFAIGKQSQNFAMTIPNIRDALSKARPLADKPDQSGPVHDLAEVYQRYSIATAFQINSLYTYIVRMDEAVKKKQTTADGIVVGKKERLQLTRNCKRILLAPIESDLRSIVSDPGLEASRLRNDREILELQDAFAEAQRVLESPTTDISVLFDFTKQSRARRDRIVQSLRTKLGVPPQAVAERAKKIGLHEYLDLNKTEW